MNQARGKKHRYRENTGFIDPKTLPINQQGYRCCRYCYGSVIPPRRTFCSANCVHEYRLRSNGTYLRQQVYQRDRGICAICKLDTKELARRLFVLSIDDPERKKLLSENNIHVTRAKKIKLRKNGGGLWDADHIVCVKDGGGQCGLDNIRTLCIKCHKERTASCASKKNNQTEPQKFQIKLKNDQSQIIKFRVKLKNNPSEPKKLQIKLKNNLSEQSNID